MHKALSYRSCGVQHRRIAAGVINNDDPDSKETLFSTSEMTEQHEGVEEKAKPEADATAAVLPTTAGVTRAAKSEGSSETGAATDPGTAKIAAAFHADLLEPDYVATGKSLTATDSHAQHSMSTHLDGHLTFLVLVNRASPMSRASVAPSSRFLLA